MVVVRMVVLRLESADWAHSVDHQHDAIEAA
jgi:hypothetical protein